MKVKITGNVQNENGRMTGIVDLPNNRASRLIVLGVAEPVDKNAPITLNKDNQNDFIEHAHKVMKEQSDTIEKISKENSELKDQVKKLQAAIDNMSKEAVKKQVDIGEKSSKSSDGKKNESKKSGKK